MKTYIIFGAGRYGQEALLYYGISNVAFFCDNKKFGTIVKGIEVIDFSKFLKIYNQYKIIVAVSRLDYRREIESDLQKYGVNYDIFSATGELLLESNFAGKYHFYNRSKQKEKMLMILAGYKDFLWGSVFARVKKYIPTGMDVCVLTAGYENTILKQLCEEMQWSYLYTETNQLALVQNFAIQEHPKAKWIYKMDEDIFLTQGVLEELLDTYHYVQDKGEYSVGIVAPIMGVNGYGYQRILKHFGFLKEFENKFGKATSGRGPIFSDPDAAVFMWEKSLPLDSFSSKLKKSHKKFSICPHRFSIGLFLIPRINWEKMGGFMNAPEGVLGVDEEYLCQWCINSSNVIVVAEKAFAGHFAFGSQTEQMKQFYLNRQREFDT